MARGRGIWGGRRGGKRRGKVGVGNGRGEREWLTKCGMREKVRKWRQRKGEWMKGKRQRELKREYNMK